MNEVKPTPVSPLVKTVSTVSSETSSKDSVTVENKPVDGKELPVSEEQVLSSKAEAANIEQAVTEINDFVQSVQRDLHFSIDEDSGLTVVRVRDKESGDLIRQIPEDIFLSLAQNLKDNQTINLFDAHG